MKTINVGLEKTNIKKYKEGTNVEICPELTKK